VLREDISAGGELCPRPVMSIPRANNHERGGDYGDR